MDLQLLSIIAGTISSFIFAGGNIPMLWKVYRTRDVRSYSGLNVLMVNIGNLLYWFYVVNLPLGPIWILHTFYTVASGILLIMYLRFFPSRLSRERFRPALSPCSKLFTQREVDIKEGTIISRSKSERGRKHWFLDSRP